MQTDAHPPLPLSRAQERALCAHAANSGDWTRLAYFYWGRGAHASLDALRETLGTSDGNLRGLFQVALAHVAPVESPVPPSAINKPWILYYLAAQALRQGDTVYALRCAKRCLELTPNCNPLFMLLIRHDRSQGDGQLAHSLGKRLLALSDAQDDIRFAIEQPFDTPQAPHQGGPAPITIGYYVPVYNAARSIAPVLEGILSQGYPLADLVVVDDGSTDDSAALAASYPVRLLSHAGNKGLATARNTALEAMDTEFVGSCDSDAVLDPDYLIYAAIEWESALSPLTSIGGRMMEQHTGSLADSWRDMHMTQDTGPLRKCSVAQSAAPVYLPGCNTVLHRKTALTLGGYDTRHVAVGEDGYMNRLLHQHGHGMATTPLARCRHLRRDTPASVLRTRWNYEWELRNRKRSFATMHRLSQLLKELLRAAQAMSTQDLRNKHYHLLPMEVLYICHMYLHSLQHGWEQGALTRGQWHWYERAFWGGAFPEATLRAWCLERSAALGLSADTPYEPPSPYLIGLNQQTLREISEWLETLLPYMGQDRLSATQ